MKRFLASVGKAKLLGKVKGDYVHIADVRTLTESTLSFSSTQEEIRAGQGAQLYGRFAHDSSMTCTLTDAMFDIDYVAMQVGSTLKGNDEGAKTTGLYTESFSSTDWSNNKVVLKDIPQQLGGACGLDHYFIWVREKGCKADDDWHAFEIDATEAANAMTTGITIPENLGLSNKPICVEYFIDKPGQRAIQVKSNFIPAELILILTTNLFSGDANNPETGKPVGEITVKIPRFSLDGQFDLSMAMSAASTMSLQGSALAVSDGECEGNGVYAEIVEVLNTTNFVEDLVDVILDPEHDAAGDVPEVWGKFSNGIMSRIANSHLKIYGANSFDVTPSATGKLASGDNFIVVYDVQQGLPATGTIFWKKTAGDEKEESVKNREVGEKSYTYYVVEKVIS